MTMNEILKINLANGFQDFAGSTVTGSLPVKEEFINQILAEVVARSDQPSETAPPSSPQENAGGLSASLLFPLLKKAVVRATPGVITIDFELKT